MSSWGASQKMLCVSRPARCSWCASKNMNLSETPPASCLRTTHTDSKIWRVLPNLRQAGQWPGNALYVWKMKRVTDTIEVLGTVETDRKSTRLNSSHSSISYAV